jgi:hypothetical protein
MSTVKQSETKQGLPKFGPHRGKGLPGFILASEYIKYNKQFLFVLSYAISF